MSYDFYAVVDTGGAEPHCIEPHFCDLHPALSADGVAGNVMVSAAGGYARIGNYTSNVGPIWTKCLTAAAGEELNLADLAGRQMGELVALLRAAVEWGVEHIDELHELDPPNGWGNATGAITYLWDIQRFCEMHPNARLGIWR